MMISRIIQHEYDHNEGIYLLVIKAIKKQMLKRKLNDISKGKVIQDMNEFPKK